MTGRVSGFEHWYVCERCGWHGGLDDGLCILCQNDPETFAEPARLAAVAWLEQLVRPCIYCGNEHERLGELCERCHREITADTEPAWNERYV